VALAGPAFADVAAVYRREPDAVRRMADVIRAGAASGGPWHMPPHPEVSAREARAMARYILSLDAPVATIDVHRKR
jgi:cytochrome c551/c552